MKEKNISLLQCPNCESDELKNEIYDSRAGDIIEGRVICGNCHVWYRIENGIADFLPLNLRRNDLYVKFANKFNLDFKPLVNDALDGDSAKFNQIDFFQEKFNDYEKNVVNSKYYRALDVITFVEFLKKRLKPGNFILDLCCGSGKQCVQLAKLGIETIGLDISEEMLILSRTKLERCNLLNYIDLIVGDAEKPPFRSEIFDACVLYGALHHLPNKHAAICMISDKLKPNGIFYSLDPNDSPVRFIFDIMMKIWKLYDDEASSSPLLSEKQLVQWLEEAGIENQIKYSTYIPPHLFYCFTDKINLVFLKFSDFLISKIPFLKTFAGVIIVEGSKSRLKSTV